MRHFLNRLHKIFQAIQDYEWSVIDVIAIVFALIVLHVIVTSIGTIL